MGGAASQSNLIEYKRQMWDHKHSTGFCFLKVAFFNLAARGNHQGSSKHAPTPEPGLLVQSVGWASGGSH